MKTFKHSGAAGDLIYSLPIMKHFGGGKFYLHLNQMDWIGMHYYGSMPSLFHQGRLTQDDFNYMKSFIEAQEYVESFEPLDPQKHEITHNLDRFRPFFVNHPGNYIDIYSNAFAIRDPETQSQIRLEPWLTVPAPKVVDGRTVVINRTQRWLPPQVSPQWQLWREQGLEEKAMFIGLPEEYEAFRNTIGWDIPWYATDTMLEVASVIAGSEAFIGNQSQCLALAIGLGKNYCCELRQDLPQDRNECYFGDNPRGNYF